MAKSIIPAELACGALIDLNLLQSADKGSVWEATCLRRLVLLNEDGSQGVHLPPGSVFYIPVGQMEGAYQTAMEMAAAAGDELAAGHPIGTLSNPMQGLVDLVADGIVPF